jgi:hypothetical protein
MAATAWAFFNAAKKQLSLASGGFNLDTGVYRISLHTSAANLNTSASARVLGTLASVGGEIVAQGGYAAGGRSLSNIAWTTAGDPASIKWDADDKIFTASGANLSLIKFAVIRYSTAAASGQPICWSRLSTAQFSVTTGNTLTIQFAAAGIFTLT